MDQIQLNPQVARGQAGFLLEQAAIAKAPSVEKLPSSPGTTEFAEALARAVDAIGARTAQLTDRTTRIAEASLGAIGDAETKDNALGGSLEVTL